MIRRNLYLAHRWLGIIMCLFFLMWFLSGIVMMYVPFPLLTSQERLSSLPNLEANTILVEPNAFIKRVGAEKIDSLRLTTFLERPAYFIETYENEFHGIFADNGHAIPEVTSRIASSIAIYFSQMKKENKNEKTNATSDETLITVENSIHIDQWTVSGDLNPYRPFYKVVMNDKENTHLYVSRKSGEVVRDTTKSERIWNWFGANLHWIYPVQLRKHPSVWRWVVVILSFFGVVSVLTGSLIGIIRLRLKRRYRGKDTSPYRGTSKYHHLFGLTCSLFLFTYMFSGLLSMNPFGVFNSDPPCKFNEDLYAGSFRENSPTFSLHNIQSLLMRNKGLKEIDFYHVDGTVFPLGVSMSGKTLLSSTNTQQLFEHIENAVKGSISLCDTSALIERVSKLETYDSFYYLHRYSEKPLPVYRFELRDNDETWVYINANTGEWMMAKTAKQRVQRWLYNGLHSLDFKFLIERRPLWDITVILLCVLGTLMSFTSVSIASRRLNADLRRSQCGRIHIPYESVRKNER